MGSGQRIADRNRTGPVSAPPASGACVPPRRSPMTFADLVRWRRDVRRFKTDPVPEPLLQQVLDLADLAPSVGNSQPWRIVRIESPDLRQAARDNFMAANAAAAEIYGDERRAAYESLKLAGFDTAPVHLAVFCDGGAAQGQGLGRQTMPETLDFSCVSMITLLWLAARDVGLGLGWVSILAPQPLIAKLAVPADWRFIGYLLVGWPQEEHLDPELERAGWQARTDAGTRRLRR